MIFLIFNLFYCYSFYFAALLLSANENYQVFDQISGFDLLIFSFLP